MFAQISFTDLNVKDAEFHKISRRVLLATFVIIVLKLVLLSSKDYRKSRSKYYLMGTFIWFVFFVCLVLSQGSHYVCYSSEQP